MRVVTWNMSHWQKTTASRKRAWDALLGLGADVALVQEAVPPKRFTNQVYRPIGGTRPWGSAVVGLTCEVEAVTKSQGRYNAAPVELHKTWEGSVAIGAALVGKRNITFVSLYGLIDDGYADTTVQRQLTDLVPLFDSPDHEGHIVLGGDLNITTQWNGRYRRYGDWERTTFDRIRALGLEDCMDLKRSGPRLEGCSCAHGDDCRHIRTQYHPHSKMPFQNDYVFASTKLVQAAKLRSVEVLDDADWRSLSDHLPIVVDLAT